MPDCPINKRVRRESRVMVAATGMPSDIDQRNYMGMAAQRIDVLASDIANPPHHRLLPDIGDESAE